MRSEARGDRILAIDTSGPYCAALILRDDAVLAHRHEDMSRGQAERLMPMIAEILSQCDMTWGDLDRIVVCTGPGNFTGLRIAVAAARGLAMARNIPAIGVSTFEALARDTSGPVLVCLDNGRGSILVQLYDDERPVSAAMDLAQCEQDLPAATICIGTGAKTAGAQLSLIAQPCAHPPLERLARIALAGTGQTPPSPLYVRPPDAAMSSEARPVILDA